MGARTETQTLSDLNIATTHYSKVAEPQIREATLYTRRIMAKSEAAIGDRIQQDLLYGDETVEFSSEYGATTLLPKEVLDTAYFEWKKIDAPLVLSELKIDVQNVGPARLINLLKTREMNRTRTIKRQMARWLFDSYATVSANAKAIASIMTIAADSDESHAVGGITPSDVSDNFQWVPEKLDLSGDPSVDFEELTNPSEPRFIGNILQYMYGQLSYDDMHPKIILVPQIIWDAYETALRDLKQYGNAYEADGAFDTLRFRHAKMVVEENMPGGKLWISREETPPVAGDMDSQMVFLDDDYLHFRHSPKFNFSTTPWKVHQTQDVFFNRKKWYGAFTCSRRDVNGYVIGLPTFHQIVS